MSFAGKLVLVSGGTGFVGTHFVEALLERGARVRIPVHRRPPLINDERIETIPADLSKLADCRQAAEGVDTVVHAAGAVAAAAVTAGNPMSAISTNLILTLRMLEGAWTAGVQRFLVFSSSTGYPAAEHPITEDEMWTGPTHPNYFGYGWMRRYLERVSEFVVSKSQMKIALVRPTAVYGRWDNFDLRTGHVIPALVRKAVEGRNPFEVWGDGTQVRDFLHVTDLVRGCLMMLEQRPTCEPINLGSGAAVTLEQLIRIILRAAGHDRAVLRFDPSKPIAIPFRMVDTSKAQRELGFTPQVSLEEGLADTVQWYRETGHKYATAEEKRR